LRVKSYWRVTSQSGNFQIGLDDACRQFPFMSTVATTGVTINGETLSDNTSDKIHALWTYGNTASDRGTKLSAAGAMPDSYQTYSDYVALGTARNPLGSYGEVDSEQSRGGIEYTIISPTVVEFSTTEPLMISPFLSGLQQDEGMVNVDRINVSFRHKSDLQRVWSHAGTGQAISGLTVEFTRAPELLATFITPDSLEQIPASQALNYHKLQDYVQRTELVASGANSQVVQNSLKLTQVPDRMYLFLKQARDTESFETSDSFARINNVSILWNNQSSLLSGATIEDLYKMSVENGLNTSFPAFARYRGSVVCVDFGKDVGLPASEAPGSRGTYAMQVTTSFRNIGQASQTFESWIVLQYGGVFTISEHQASASLGMLDQATVLATMGHPSVPHHVMDQLQGGGFWSSLKNIVKTGGQAALQAAPLLESAAMALGHPEISAGIGAAAGVGRALGGGLKSGGTLHSGGRLARRRVR
jgi:hypothetical protein